MAARPQQKRMIREEALVECFADWDSIKNISNFRDKSDWGEESCSEESSLEENIEEDKQPVAVCILLW